MKHKLKAGDIVMLVTHLDRRGKLMPSVNSGLEIGELYVVRWVGGDSVRIEGKAFLHGIKQFAYIGTL